MLKLLLMVAMMVAAPDIRKFQDFETHARSFWTVQARDKSVPIPFIFNAPQRIIEYECRTLREACKRVLLKILKMRQGGISTYCSAGVQHYCSSGRGRLGFSIADKLDLPKAWLDRAKVWHEQTPGILRPHLKKSNSMEMLFDGLSSNYRIGSQLGQTVGMGFTPQKLHCSELSDWSNPKKITDDLFPGVPKDNPDSSIMLEGTGWMVGTWWCDQCTMSMEGEDDFKFIFLPWFIMPNYAKPPIGVIIDFTEKDYTEEEIHVCHLAMVWAKQHPEHAYLAGFKGLTLGHIAWRRWIIRNEFSGDVVRFSSKYPATPEEAFMSAGSLSIPLEIIKHHMETVRVPLRYVTLRRDPGGHVIADDCDKLDRLAWTIYEEPKEYREYAVGGDPAEGSLSDTGDERSDRDRSGGAVLDRRRLAFVAEFCTQQIAPDLFGEQLKMIAEYYNMAYIGAEFNNNGQATIIPCKHYPNMLMRTGMEDDIDGRDINKLWWKNTAPARKELVAAWIQGCRKQDGTGWADSIQVYSDRLVREEKTFVKNPAGKDEHRKGCFDDSLFAHMITYWTHLHTPHVRRSPMGHLKTTKRRRSSRPAIAYAGGVDDCKGV